MSKYTKSISRRRFLKGATIAGAGIAVFGLEACTPETTTLQVGEDNRIHFDGYGKTAAGEWDAEATLGAAPFQNGAGIDLKVTLSLPNVFLQKLAEKKITVENFCLLVTAERTFDAAGIQRLPSHERMSTFVTPTGLAIEGGVQGAVTRRFGGRYKTPVDEFVAVPLTTVATVADERKIEFEIKTPVPSELPPGIYRLRLDFGVVAKGKNYSLAGLGFAQRPATADMPAESHFFSMPLRVSSKSIDGASVDAVLSNRAYPGFSYPIMGPTVIPVSSPKNTSPFSLSRRAISSPTTSSCRSTPMTTRPRQPIPWSRGSPPRPSKPEMAFH